MSNAAAVVVGAAISGLIGVLVVVLQQRLQHRRKDHEAIVERLASFVAAGWVMTIATENLAKAKMTDKSRVEEESADHLFRYLLVLAQIQLLDDAPVYEAALDVDLQLTALHDAARSTMHTRAEWFEARRPLTKAVLAFRRIARRALGSSEVTPREPSSDALWS